MVTAFTGVIIAGGENTRMNAFKPLLSVGGHRIIDRQIRALREVFEELVVVSGAPEEFAGLDVRVVPDDEAFAGIRGPMTGVYTGLKHAPHGAFVVACDMPFINPLLMSRLAGLCGGHDLVIPVVGGLAEPLFGVYKRAALGVMEEALARGERRLQALFGGLDVLYVGEDELTRYDPELSSFVNVNTPSDLEMAENIAGRTDPAGLCGVSR